MDRQYEALVAHAQNAPMPEIVDATIPQYDVFKERVADEAAECVCGA